MAGRKEREEMGRGRWREGESEKGRDRREGEREKGRNRLHHTLFTIFNKHTQSERRNLGLAKPWKCL